MKRNFLIPSMSVCGVILAIFVMVITTKKPTKAASFPAPAKVTFSSFVSGSGLVESSSENLRVSSNAGGVVVGVFVQPGDEVAKGQALWQIDPAPKRAELARYKAALASADALLAKQRLGSRPEEIEKQKSLVAQAHAQADDAATQLKLRESAFTEEARAVSLDEINQAKAILLQRQAALAYADQELERLRNGTWKPDMAIQEATVAESRAQLEQGVSDLERLTVRSPIKGIVLQVKIHPGEFAPAGQTTDPLMLIGARDSLVVRAQIDENDAWRVSKNEAAVGYPRGRSQLQIPLTFVRCEPFIVPKKSLTGDSNERVDTRVLEVLYKFQLPQDVKVFVGQQMDVYIKAPELSAPAGNASALPNGGK